MDYIAQVTMQALNEQSDVYSYSMFKVITTMNAVVALKNAFPSNTTTPETEAALQSLTRDYLHVMELIPQHAAQRILQALQQASAPPDDGLLGALIDAFIEYLAGRR
jgi:hypothetical protein